MAYDEQLANRIRQFGTWSDITERKMFGDLAFLYLGRMCCGIVGRDLMVRIPDDEFHAVMRGRHVQPMDVLGRAASTGQCVVLLYDAARRHAISWLIIGNRHDACTTFAYTSIEDLMAFIDRRFASGPIQFIRIS